VGLAFDCCRVGFCNGNGARSCLLPPPHRWLPGAVFIGNLVPFPTKGAKEWPDLYDWNLPGRFTTSPLGATGGSRFTKMKKIVLGSWACLAKPPLPRVF